MARDTSPETPPTDAGDGAVKRVLVPLDFSPVSDAVIEWAARLALRFGAQLRLLHVAAPDPDFVGYRAGPDVVREQRASELRDEHRTLQARAEALRQRGVEAEARLVEGPTVEKILEEARSAPADLVVMGSHGHGALFRALLGSVSEGVVRGARCPVTIVPARSDDAS